MKLKTNHAKNIATGSEPVPSAKFSEYCVEQITDTMTNYFELFDRQLTEIRQQNQEILARLAVTNSATDEVGGLALAQQVTRLSAARIYTLVSKRLIPHKKRGNRLYFNRAQLLAWVEQGNRETIGGPEHE